jgi:hypothetical protein
MSTEPLRPTTQRGAALLVSYEKLLDIERGILRTESMLKALLTMRRDVEDLSLRVNALEQVQAQDIARLQVHTGYRTRRNTTLSFLAGVVTSAIGGGALTFLPTILGWLK